MSSLWPATTPEGGYITAPPLHADTWPRRLIIMGSTGSIGRNTLDVVSASGGALQIAGLACGQNIQELARQARRWRPEILGVAAPELVGPLRSLLPLEYQPQIVSGPTGFAQMAGWPSANWIVCAQVGIAGLVAAFAAALKGKAIALANKETLVIAGELLRHICRANSAAILPVDSEHYAIFQCLAGRPENEIKSLILTASGGPFFKQELAAIYHASPRQALAHPNWKMGAKISIDSATLMNKGLEFLEAMHLYGVNADNIQILVQPQSIVHSLVAFDDNSVLAQMSLPDMRLPISGCLYWPKMPPAIAPPLRLEQIGSISFSEPDTRTFSCLHLAMEIARKYKKRSADTPHLESIILNAANETAVELFLQEKCLFGQIPEIIAATLAFFNDKSLEPVADLQSATTIADEIYAIDRQARAIARQFAEMAPRAKKKQA